MSNEWHVTTWITVNEHGLFYCNPFTDTTELDPDRPKYWKPLDALPKPPEGE